MSIQPTRRCKDTKLTLNVSPSGGKIVESYLQLSTMLPKIRIEQAPLNLNYVESVLPGNKKAFSSNLFCFYLLLCW